MAMLIWLPGWAEADVDIVRKKCNYVRRIPPFLLCADMHKMDRFTPSLPPRPSIITWMAVCAAQVRIQNIVLNSSVQQFPNSHIDATSSS